MAPPGGAPFETEAAIVRADAPTDVLADTDKAIGLATDYLLRSQHDDGSFMYVVDPKRPSLRSRRYNILRHAGTMYALGQAARHQVQPSASAEAIAGAATYLRQRLTPVPGAPALLAVATLPDLDGQHRHVAKLGASGLALIALTTANRLRPGTVRLDELRAIGDFVRFMQKPDGGFVSLFDLDDPMGTDDSWVSLYYPGEAALGLIELAEVDADGARFRDAAVGALSFLARSRNGEAKVPADHWALLATARLLETDGGTLSTLDKAAVEHHARQVVASIVGKVPSSRSHGGALTAALRTTPTATRLEGLIAARATVDLGSVTPLVDNIIDRGISFLLRGQYRAGPYAGGMPARITRSSAAGGTAVDEKDRRIRVDYVQHALSAFIGHARARSAGVSRRGPRRPMPGPTTSRTGT